VRQRHLGKDLGFEPRGAEHAALLDLNHRGAGGGELAQRLVGPALQPEHGRGKLARLRVDDRRPLVAGQPGLLRDRIGQPRCQPRIEARGERAVDLERAVRGCARLDHVGHGPGEYRRHRRELAAVQGIDRLEIAQQPRLDPVAQRHRAGLAEQPCGLVGAAEVRKLQRAVDGRLVAPRGERRLARRGVVAEQVGAEELFGLGVFAGVVAAVALADQLLRRRRARRARRRASPSRRW
jgi:hypothetical protein